MPPSPGGHLTWPGSAPLPGAGLHGPSAFTSPDPNPNPTPTRFLSGPWGCRVGRPRAGSGLWKPCAVCPGAVLSWKGSFISLCCPSLSCQLSVTPWSQGQRELAGWWQGDLMGPLRQSQAGRREASRQRQARRAGTRARGCSELVWEPVVLQEARKRVGLQVELSDAFQELLETELLNPQGLSGVSGGPGTSLDSSRRFLQRSCSGPFLKDAGTGQEATCAPVGHIRGCLSSPGLQLSLEMPKSRCI